jgi:hydroxyacyl-ACP dehydratase HTD2-like protein with hotdog domain
MLSVLRRQLEKGEEVKSLSYRNLAPLYAQEEIRVCVRRDREKAEKFEVWVEGGSGGYAVKGSATISRTESELKEETKGGPRILRHLVY